MDTSDRRLELVRSVRQEQERNSETMRQWESAFYGRGGTYLPDSAPMRIPMSGFRLRFFVALILFMAFLVMDKNNWAIGKIDTGAIYEKISSNIKGFDFGDIFTYTVED